MHDLCIANGILVDGTGNPAIAATLYIRDGRIACIAPASAAREAAKQVIDARGCIVSPGFVDVHTHYDAQVFWDPTLSPSCFHGVTTVIGGNCGFTIAPLSGKPEDAEYLKRMLARVEGMPLESLEQGVPWGTWKSFGDYLDKLEHTLAINAGFLVGHSALRRAAMGERSLTDKASDADLETMKTLLRESLKAGGLGFSTTVSPTHNDMEGRPVPSRAADDAELFALAKIVSEFPGTTLEFLPGTSEFTDEIRERMVNFSLAGKRPVNWNAYVPGNPKLSASQLGATDLARSRGAEVVALTIPSPVITRINLHSAFIFDAFHDWAETMRLPIPQRIQALKDPELRKKLDAGAKSEKSGVFIFMSGWEGYTVDEPFLAKNKHYKGRKIGDIAKELGKSAFDTLLDLAIEEDLRTSFIPLSYGDDDFSWQARADAWLDDRTVIGASDAGAHLDMIDTFAFSTQVLSNGVRKRHFITLEQAVHQLTGVPAKLVGLKDRGVLKEGYRADIAIFDIDKIACGATYTKFDLPGGAGRLYADAEGIHHVIVNGVEIIRDNVLTGTRPGTVLHSGRDTDTVEIPAAKFSLPYEIGEVSRSDGGVT